MSAATSAEATVRSFLAEVRSGRRPEAAREFMADRVAAHQLDGEQERTIVRTPDEYAEHVREMVAEHGSFEFTATHLVASGDLVAVMWRQASARVVDPIRSRPLVELASCTYRVDDRGRIAEYWLLLDRLGMERQLAVIGR